MQPVVLERPLRARLPSQALESASPRLGWQLTSIRRRGLLPPARVGFRSRFAVCCQPVSVEGDYQSAYAEGECEDSVARLVTSLHRTAYTTARNWLASPITHRNTHSSRTSLSPEYSLDALVPKEKSLLFLAHSVDINAWRTTHRRRSRSWEGRRGRSASHCSCVGKPEQLRISTKRWLASSTVGPGVLSSYRNVVAKCFTSRPGMSALVGTVEEPWDECVIMTKWGDLYPRSLRTLISNSHPRRHSFSVGR